MAVPIAGLELIVEGVRDSGLLLRSLRSIHDFLLIAISVISFLP